VLEKILDQWANALGGRKRLRAVESISKRGRIYGFGSQGKIHEWAAPGCYRSHYTLEIGVDALLLVNGKQGWSKRDGRVTAMGGFELLLQKVRMWLETFALVLPELNEVPVRFSGKSEDGSAWLLELEVMEGLVCQCLVDRRSHLPKEYSFNLGSEALHVRFGDWRKVSGITLPFRQTDHIEPSGDEIRSEFDEMLVNTLQLEGLFDRPADEAPLYEFANSQNALGIPFELNANKVYFQVSINGQPPVWIVLDSGMGGNLALDTEYAKAIGLEVARAGSTGGAGENMVEAGIAKGVTIGLPGLVIKDQTINTMPLVQVMSPAEGRQPYGLLGGELIGQWWSRLTMCARCSISMTPLTTSLQRRLSCRSPLIRPTFHRGHRHAAGLPTGAGAFLLDIGVRNALNMTAPFVDRNGLMNSTQKLVYGIVGSGIGGLVREYVGRGSLKLGPADIAQRFEFENIVVNLSQAKAGFESASIVAGIIGDEIMRRFKLTLDYNNQRFLLQPNEHFSQSFEFDMSGTFLRAEPPDYRRFTVAGTVEGGPAAEAGLQEGDELLAIDGQPAAVYSLETLRQFFRQPERSVALRLRRGEQELETTLITRRQV
jgi:hypothetical protein